jgi:MoxR-like ATPase
MSKGPVKRANPKPSLEGRADELLRLRACMGARRNVLLEGPVGVGKTHLALAALVLEGASFHRIDGDSRYTEQKLAGWFDPPAVLKKGYVEAAFVPGPLVRAMRDGAVLFINELNRLPEGVQNILLPAIDEGVIDVPRLGQVRAQPGFLVVATQNPTEFVATSHLSEAILDRFELIRMDYQTEEEERAIVLGRLLVSASDEPRHALESLSVASVRLARLTRHHPRVKRGASVRAALAVGELTVALRALGLSRSEAFLRAALLSLPTRIEIERDSDPDSSPQEALDRLIREWVDEALRETFGGLDEAGIQKKKTP